jgi:hopanoid biosynthesis associated RND transporter like protein HpnN
MSLAREPDLDGRCARVVAGVVTASLRARFLVLIAAVALSVLALFACMRFLGMSTNTVDMIDPDVPFRQHAKAFNAAFPQLDKTIVAIVDAPTPERAAEAAERLRAKVAELDTVRDVYAPGTGFLRTHGLLYLETPELTRLIDRLADAEPLLATLARQPDLGGLAEILNLAADSDSDRDLPGFAPLLDEMASSARAQTEGRPRKLSWQALMADAGDENRLTGQTRQFVVMQPELDYGKLKPASTAIAGVRTAAEAIAVEHRGAVDIRLTGEAVITTEELASVETGGVTAGVLSILAVTIILGIGFGGVRALAACLITLLAGLLWTAGIAAALIGTLNLISVAFAVLFVGLGIDFCIHYTLRFREAGVRNRKAALVQAGEGVGCAMLLSAGCAAIGFLSFLPTAYRGLAELGLIAGIGMGVAVATSLTLLPVLLKLFRARARTASDTPRTGTGEPWLVRQRRNILRVAVLVLAAGATLAPGIRFDMNPMNLRDANSPAMRAFTDLARNEETTPYVVNALADNVDDAEALAARFRAAPMFGGARTLASFVPEEQEAKLAAIGDAAFFLAPVLRPASDASGRAEADLGGAYAEIRSALDRLAERSDDVGRAAGEVIAALNTKDEPPDLAELSDRWTGYLPRMLTFLRDGLTVDRVERSDIPADLRARWQTADGRARVTARPVEPIQDNGEIRRFAEAALAVTPRATGAPVTIHKASETVIGAFVRATAYAAAAILIILALTLGRSRDVPLALAPLVVAVVLTLATAAMTGIPLNFANVIVLPLLMGLGVSSGIHLVLRARQTGDVASAMGSSTPRAVAMSVLTTLASFGTLMVAEHRGMSSMGALLTIAVGFTLFAVLVMLPALLASFQRRPHGPHPTRAQRS